MPERQSRSRRIVVGVVAAAAIATVLLGGWLAWAALGPAITHACPAPGLAPDDPGWSLVETRLGWFNGPGDIRGSSTEWHDQRGRSLLLVAMATGPEGELGGTIVRVRGTEGRSWGDEVVWREGTLGCAWYDLTIDGEASPDAELLSIAERLR